jgi:hypothetical protein
VDGQSKNKYTIKDFEVSRGFKDNRRSTASEEKDKTYDREAHVAFITAFDSSVVSANAHVIFEDNSIEVLVFLGLNLSETV